MYSEYWILLARLTWQPSLPTEPSLSPALDHSILIKNSRVKGLKGSSGLELTLNQARSAEHLLKDVWGCCSRLCKAPCFTVWDQGHEGRVIPLSCNQQPICKTLALDSTTAVAPSQIESSLLFFFFFEGGWSLEAESGYVAQVSLELVVFLLQPPKCWGNSSVPTCLTSHEMTWNISTFVFILLLLYLLYAFNILHTLILPSYFLWSKTDNKQSDVWVIWIFVLVPGLLQYWISSPTSCISF